MQDLLQIISLQASGLSSNEMLGLSSIVLVASVIRGYAGFGFSAIVVAGASLFLPTREVVPLVLLLEIVASLQMATQVWQHVNWRMVLSILAASVLFIPLGQYVLLWVEVEPMRVIAAILMLAAVVIDCDRQIFPCQERTQGMVFNRDCVGFYEWSVGDGWHVGNDFSARFWDQSSNCPRFFGCSVFYHRFLCSVDRIRPGIN